jgi:hypothetical protein
LSSTETFQDNGWELSSGFFIFQAFLKERMDFQFSAVQPCIARNLKATILIHVDDILVVGLKSFWEDVFLKEMKQKFSISHEQLDGVGSSIKFLRRTMTETNDGLVITPGTKLRNW